MRAHFQDTLESLTDVDGSFARDILNELQRIAASHQPEPEADAADEFVDI